MPRVLLFAIPIAMFIYALADVVQADESELGRIPKWAWVLLVTIVPVAGPLTWIILSNTYKREAKEASKGSSFGPARPSKRRPDRPLAPDDDPDFLWRLEKQQRIRRQAEEARRAAERGQGGTGQGGSGQGGTGQGGTGQGGTGHGGTGQGGSGQSPRGADEALKDESPDQDPEDRGTGGA